MTEEKAPVQEVKLDPESELRFEVEGKNEKVTLELKSGLAEIFGTELVKEKKYEFTCGAKIAVFTWQGCVLELAGKTESSYIAKETPMELYLNCHVVMEKMRKVAEKEDSRGPVVMIVGPCDVGKSTLCRILLNYAVRTDRRPIYVDLDVGQGRLAVPGTVGALFVNRTSDVVHGFSQKAPLVLHFGHKTPNTNPVLYNLLVTRLAEIVRKEICSHDLKANKKAIVSGTVINTCGWIKKDGYEILTHAAKAFEVDTILVLDQEQLYSKLANVMPAFVNVVFLPKSRGVVERSAIQRNEARDQSIKEYFYGSITQLYPYSFEVKWSEVKIFKIGAPTLPSSCIPLGTESENNNKKLVAVSPNSSLLHHILSVSFAESPSIELMHRCVIGFVCVTNVNVERETLTILSPQPRPLPNHILLLSEIQFVDSH